MKKRMDYEKMAAYREGLGVLVARMGGHVFIPKEEIVETTLMWRITDEGLEFMTKPGAPGEGN